MFYLSLLLAFFMLIFNQLSAAEAVSPQALRDLAEAEHVSCASGGVGQMSHDYSIYKDEIAALGASRGAKSYVVINDESKAIAPQVTGIIEHMALDIATKLACQVPELRIEFSNDLDSYAAMTRFTKVRTLLHIEKSYERLQDGSKVLRQERSVFRETNDVCIIIGAQKILLLFQYAEHLQFLYASLAHEFGHMILDHSSEDSSPEMERAADAVAVSALGDPNLLIQSLEMTLHAMHLCQILMAFGQPYELTVAVINNVLPRLTSEFYCFGKLGGRGTASHSKVIMLKMLERKVKKDLLAGGLSFEDICQKIYDCLKVCCQSPRDAFNGLRDCCIGEFCLAVDRLPFCCVQEYCRQLDGVSKHGMESFCAKIKQSPCGSLRCKKTHPGPKSRACAIRNAYQGSAASSF